MTRCIYIPGVERWVSLGAYMRAVKTAKANPDEQFKQGITCWWPCTGREIVAQFLDGVHDRINQAVPVTKRGMN